MDKFLYDMIHMTEGEKLVNYWQLYLSIFVALVFLTIMYTMWDMAKYESKHRRFK